MKIVSLSKRSYDKSQDNANRNFYKIGQLSGFLLLCSADFTIGQQVQALLMKAWRYSLFYYLKPYLRGA